MVVFDKDFVDKLHRVNATRPASYRSDLHFFVTSPERRALREWVERTVGLLPEPGRSALSRRLRADSNFVTAINDVAVASVLQSAGLTPESGPRFGSLTPDLFVPATVDCVPLMLEVWTRQPRSGEPARRRGWLALVERVAKIPVGLSVILVPKTRRAGPPDRTAIAQIGRELHGWMSSAGRTSGDVYEVLGYRFQVAGPSPHGDHAFMPRPNEGGTVNKEASPARRWTSTWCVPRSMAGRRCRS